MEGFKGFIFANKEFVIVAIQIIIAVAVVFVLNRIIVSFSRRFRRRFKSKKSIWFKSFLHAIELPICVFLWSEVFLFVVHVIANHWSLAEILNQILRFNKVFFVLVTGWILLRWIKYFEKVWMKVKGIDEITSGLKIDVVGRLFRCIVVIFTIVTIMDVFDINLTAILTFGGIGIAAVGLASKDVVANFFGGFMIYVTRPFALGDWISSPDRNIDGTVSEIGWYMTKIYTLAKRPVYIPNSIFSNVIVMNNTRMLNRRIKETFGVRYKDVDVVDPIVRDVRTMLKTHPEIDQDRVLLVHFISFNSSSLDIQVYVFTKTTDWEEWLNIQQDVFLKISDIVKKHGAQMAFPTRTLDVPEEFLKI